MLTSTSNDPLGRIGVRPQKDRVHAVGRSVVETADAYSAFLESSFPENAQLSGATSLKMMLTDSGLQLQNFTIASVMASAVFCF